MEFDSIEHHGYGNFAYALNENELIINIKTNYDISSVFIIYKDPYFHDILSDEKLNDNVFKVEMHEKLNLKHQRWWSKTINPPFKRLKYYFELHSGKEIQYLFEDGLMTCSQFDNDQHSKQWFVNPWMNKADLNTTSKWVNATIWYQIFPDRFCNGHYNNPPLIKTWNNGKKINAHDEFYGGDLQGIIDKMDYLIELGINGIYLTPIFKANSNHKYDTIDYMEIDPHFGDKTLFKQLVDLCHHHHIRIMLDGVFNHTSYQHPYWQDVLAKGPLSKYYDWYMVNNWPIDQKSDDTKNGAFYSFAFCPFMPKLNTNNNEVIDYLLSVCEYWVKNFDIDGLRLDVANEISHKFNKALRKKMTEIKPDFYILGEIWHEACSWLMGDEFHSVMNYPLSTAIGDYFNDKTLNCSDFEAAINRCYTMYMKQTNDVLFNLLDSHDTPRLFTRVNENINIFFQQIAILFTMPGSPCIYYGTEIAMPGSYDPDCRRCMPWLEIEQHKHDQALLLMKTLIKMRKEHYAFRSPKITFTFSSLDQRVIKYIKTDNAQQMEVIINASEQDIKIEDQGKILFANLLASNILKRDGVVIRYV